MFDIPESNIDLVAVHHIGNPALQQALQLSESLLDIEDEKLGSLLKTYFLANFSTPEFYSFTFPGEDVTQNPVYQFAMEIFEDLSLFQENSIQIARHLYHVTQHPNIKAGDLFIAYITNLAVNGSSVDAIGIFKSENKEPYLKLKSNATHFDLFADEGINSRKLDKGCLILKQEQESGFKILIADNKSDAQFWRNDFLHVKPWSDDFHHTHQFMNLTRQYVAEQVPEEFSVSKADQIDLLNRSVNFFKSKEQFNRAEFETEVLNDADLIESFRNYGKSFMTENGLDPVDHFEISAQAVKRQARIFKSVLKLDKNFHIYIHGNRELIEKGFDEVTGKHYYKLFFDEES